MGDDLGKKEYPKKWVLEFLDKESYDNKENSYLDMEDFDNQHISEFSSQPQDDDKDARMVVSIFDGLENSHEVVHNFSK